MWKRLVPKFMALFTVFLGCLVLFWPMVLYTVKNKHIRAKNIIPKHAKGSSTKRNILRLLPIANKTNKLRIPLPRITSVYRENKETDEIDIKKHNRIKETKSSLTDIDHPTKVYKYYFTTSVMVRISIQDKSKWTIKELKQWMHYLFYAGVEHIYLCNHYVSTDERLRPLLSRYINDGLLTYIDWPWNASNNKGKIIEHQLNCYYHVIAKYGNDSKWQMSIDMDEYPFCNNDFRQRFLSRYLHRKDKGFQTDLKDVSQILMENFLMMGQGNRSKTMAIERINRITKKRYNKLSKAIFRPRNVLKCWVHWWDLAKGDTIHADTSELRMLHYWGRRTQNWGPDTRETIELTKVFLDVANGIAPMVRKSLLSFGENDAFSNETGP